MANILLRISQIAENENISITSLEKKIGASAGVLSRAIRKGTDIQSKWVQCIIENYHSYSPEWLLTGKGSMLKEGIGADAPTTNMVSEPQVPYGKANVTAEQERLLLIESINRVSETADRNSKNVNELIAQGRIQTESLAKLVDFLCKYGIDAKDELKKGVSADKERGANSKSYPNKAG